MPLATFCPHCPAGTKEKRCAACKYCKIHAGCRCRPCGICKTNQPPKILCPKCGRCKSHHNGLASRNNFPLRGCSYKQPVTGAPVTKKLCDLTRSVGVELELSTGATRLAEDRPKNPTNPAYTYRFEHDGSVTGGLELVSTHASGDSLYTGLQGLGQLMTSYACAADATCGFHVHVDSADYTGLELRNIMVGYQLIQEQLYKGLVSPTRAQSHFCKAYAFPMHELHQLCEFTKSSDFIHWFNKRFYGVNPPSSSDPELARLQEKAIAEKIASYKAKKYMNDARRWALNFHSYMMRGTLEFRLKEGTADPETILYWPIFCGYLIEALANTEPKALYSWMKDTPKLTSLLSHRKSTGFQAWLKKNLELAQEKLPVLAFDDPEPEILQPPGFAAEPAEWDRFWANEQVRQDWQAQAIRRPGL